MEFMDRRNRSLPVQFWLTVESFKNPLEAIDSDSSGDEDESIKVMETSVNAKEDISMIHDLYFAGPSVSNALSSIARKHVEGIRKFVAEVDPSPTSQRKVRRNVLLAQRQVEKDMEQDFEEFERSELWFRAVGDAGFSTMTPELELPAPPLPLPESADNRPSQLLGVMKAKTPLQPSISSQSVHAQSNSINRSISGGSAKSTPPLPAQSSIEVLMSPIAENSSTTRAPLFDDPEDAAQREEHKRMEAIHAALTDIMALEQEEKQDSSPGSTKTSSRDSPRPSSHKRRSSIFDDSQMDVEERDYGEGEEAESLHESQRFQLAAPGDLQLSLEISRLSEKINNLKAQEDMLETLLKKAELTGDEGEVNILHKSKAAMNRDIRELEFQKQQYEQQESANKLISDRTRVSIVSSTAAEENGRSVVRYLIEIQQLAPDGTFASGWVVARRYNEFLNMHNKLRERYVMVKTLDFPGKRLVASLSSSSLDSRKQGLEKYLQVRLHPVFVQTVVLQTHPNRVSSRFQSSVRALNCVASSRETPPSLHQAPIHTLLRNRLAHSQARISFETSIVRWQKTSTTCSLALLCSKLQFSD